MKRYIPIALLWTLLYPPSAFSYDKKNKVYESDVRLVLHFIYKAQTAATPEKSAAHIRESLKYFEKASKKLSTQRKKLLADSITNLPKTNHEQVASEIIEEFELTTTPVGHPQYARGRQVYESLCQQCHGATGLGDGPLSSRLAIKTPSFGADYISGFRCYNFNFVGDKESGKANIFSLLDTKTLWSACFYALSLESDGLKSGQPPSCKLTLENLATATNTEYKSLSRKCRVSESTLRSAVFDKSIPRN